MSEVYRREAYLRKIRPFYHDDMIKVITGIRRCGKSCLLLSIQDELRERGVPEKDIVYLDLDKRGMRSVRTPGQLDALIEKSVTDDDYRYLFIDEVQNVEGFEEVVNGLREDERAVHH